MSSGGFTFLSQGAVIQTFPVSGHNIVLGFPEPDLYCANNSAYFGETIGRVANRIKDAKLLFEDGREYSLPQNDGLNCLHGGRNGWGKQIFQGPRIVTRRDREALEYTYTSADGDEGFPGTLECRVWYSSFVRTFESVLDIEYEVEFTGAECVETIASLTNHSYFNLNPNSTTNDTSINLSTDWHLQMDGNQIPTGKIQVYGADTRFVLSDTTPMIDDCFVMDPDETFTSDTRKRPLRTMVQMFHPHTNLHLEVSSTEPAFQLYTGDGINVPALSLANGQSTLAMGPRSGIAVEPCRYVDAQRKEWRKQCSIRQGQKWGSRIRYRGWEGPE